ncbi:MAG TPA: O-antigen ligase family protein [Gemmatimonadaceae bacterium]
MNEPESPAKGFTDLIVLLALGVGALACVLVVVPYRTFDLDRFFVPKELALHITALVAGTAAIAGTRRVSPRGADAALIAWLLFSAMSAVFATNHALAVRALTVSLSGAAVYWSARRVAAAGLGPVLARMLAIAVVIGAVTALAQAYGVRMEFAALNRAPGGLFGNRNFMAHLTAAGVPLLLWCIASTRRRAGSIFWTASLGACAAALVLSRTRAAWLALAVSAVIAGAIAIAGPPLTEDGDARRRLRRAAVAIAAGVVLAIALPNTLDWRSDSPYLDSVKGVVDYHDGSGRGRLAQYATSAKMGLQHPLFGTGPGNWAVIYPKYAPPSDPSISDATGMTANPWPSSDWIAALSERGSDSFIALAMFVVLLLGGAVKTRYAEDRSPHERLAALAGGGVLLIAVMAGLFDAVLLLPTPLLVVSAAAGALIPAGAVHREYSPSMLRRLTYGAVFAAVTVLACLLGDRRLEAMRLSEAGTGAAMEAAAAKDPGSFRVQMRAADLFLSRNECTKARPHALAARALFPYSPGPRHVLSRCKG